MTGKVLKNMPKKSIIELYGVLALDPNLSKIDAGDLLFNGKSVRGFLLPHWLEEKSIFGKLGAIRKLGKLLKQELQSHVSQEFGLEQFK